jgi:hypothetical protein
MSLKNDFYNAYKNDLENDLKEPTCPNNGLTKCPGKCWCLNLGSLVACPDCGRPISTSIIGHKVITESAGIGVSSSGFGVGIASSKTTSNAHCPHCGATQKRIQHWHDSLVVQRRDAHWLYELKCVNYKKENFANVHPFLNALSNAFYLCTLLFFCGLFVYLVASGQAFVK